MKVLMVVTYPEIGGTETHILFLAKEFRKRGIDVGIATRGGPFVPFLKRNGFRVHILSKTRASTSGRASSLASIVRNHRYNVIHVHDTESFHLLPELRRRLPKAPMIMTVHGKYYSRTELKRAAKAATRIIAVSPSVAKWLIQTGVAKHKVKWIPNGIDMQRFSPISNNTKLKRSVGLPDNTTVVLYVGRFQSDKWKNARTVILASERVARTNRRFITVLIGPGSYRKELARLAKQVNERVGRTTIVVLPPTTGIENYYRFADVVVGTGRVALEALACGKPVIAVGVAGYDGIVTSKSIRNAISNQFGDHGASRRLSADRLASDMRLLLENPTWARRIGHQGRQVIVRSFSIARIANMTRNTYLSLLHKEP